MEKPIFLVDVDGVLRDITTPMLNLYNKAFYENLKESDLKDYDVEISFPRVAELKVKASDYFFHINAKDIFLNEAPPYLNVKEAVSILREFGKVIIATNQSTIDNKKYTLDWLDKHGIEYDGIFFTPDKSLIPCNVIIDDNPYFIEHSKANTKIIVDQPYNRFVAENDRVMRYSSLYNYALELKAVNQKIQFI